MINSNQIITPEVWGPHGWKFIHYVTLSYPENPTPTQKEKYKAFLILLKDVLPCSLCANHYAENLQKLPLTDEVMSSKENLIKWGIDIHNIVNEMKNKPIINYIDARKLIDTNIQCKPIITEIISDNLETFTEENLVKPQLIKQNIKNSSCAINNDMNTVYGMIGLLILLIIIAVIYKKK